MAEDNKDAKPAEKDQVALELMKFIAVTTGYGKGTPNTGFSSGAGRSGGRTPEEYTDALLELFDRCRAAVYSKK